MDRDVDRDPLLRVLLPRPAHAVHPDLAGCRAPAAKTVDPDWQIDALRRSPAVMAQEMATVAELSKGRARFAVAAGEEKQFAPYGEKRSKPFSRLDEAVRIWYELWGAGDGAVNRDSEFWPLQDAVFPLSPTLEHKPEILVVGGGDKVLRLAGEVADGWMTYLPGGVANDVDKLAETIEQVKGIASDAGRDPEDLAFNAQVILALGEDDEQGWEYARHPNNGWLAITAASIDSSTTEGLAAMVPMVANTRMPA